MRTTYKIITLVSVTIVTYLELNYVSRIHKQQQMKIRHSTEKVSATLLIKISYETIKTLKNANKTLPQVPISF